MNEERFFDLAVKVIAQQASDAERAELEELLAASPERRTELEQLRTDVRTAKEALPLVNATEDSVEELPGYARRCLRSKVRQTLGQPGQEKQPHRRWTWGWVLGFAATAVLILSFALRPGGDNFVVKVAMLDTAGSTRGDATNEMGVLQQIWPESPILSFDQFDELSAWEKELPLDTEQSFAKVIYDRNAAEIRVVGRVEGRRFENIFPVETKLADSLHLVETYLREQTGQR